MQGRVVASLIVEVLGKVDDAIRGLNQVDSKVNATAKRMKGIGTAMIGIGAVGAAALFGVVTAAADFEQAMANVNAVTNLTGEQFEEVSNLARQLGRDTIFSATEAAGAIEELAKAGVSVEDILNGAAKGATALAAAAGVEVPQAAIIMANAMNVFKLSGDQATHVADVFAAAANKSAADVSELALGMSQSANVAAQFGISLEESVGALALFSDYGLRGSDAGTSFKTMLMSMLDPTNKQADLMRELGLSFFDANGQFIGLDATAGMLRDRLSGLTEEQRNTALAVLFGSDAVRAANIIYQAGADGVNEYTAAVNDEGAAARMAEARTKTMQGAIERMKGAILDLSIGIGEVLTPYVVALAGWVEKAAELFGALPRPFKVAAAVALALVAALLPLGVALTAIAAILPALGTAFAILTGPIGLVIAALVLLGIAYKTNFLGFADAVNFVAKAVIGALGPVIDFFGRLVQGFRDARKQGFDPISAALMGLHRALAGIGGERTPPWIAKIAKGLQTAARFVRLFVEGLRKLGKDSERVHKILNQLPAPLAKLFLVLARVKQGVDRFIKAWKEAGALAAFQTIPRSIELLGRTIGNLLQSIGLERFGQQFKQVFAEIGDVIGAVVALVDDIVHGRWSEVWDDLVDLAKNAVELFLANLKAQLALVADLFGFALDAVRAVDWGAVASFLADQGGRLVRALYEAARGFFDDTVLPWLKDLPGRISAAVPDLARVLTSKGRDLLRGLYDAARAVLTGTVLPWLRGLGGLILGAIPDLARTLIDHGTDLLRGLWDGIRGFWPTVTDFFAKLPGRIAGALPGDFATRLVGSGKKLLGGLWDGIKAVWDSDIARWFGRLGFTILGAIPSLSTVLVAPGRRLLGGFWDGILDIWDNVESFFRTIGRKIASAIPGNLYDVVTGALGGMIDAFDFIASKAQTVLDLIGEIGGFLGLGGGEAGGKPAPDTGQPPPLPSTGQTMGVTFDPGTSLADIEAWASGVADALEPLARYVIFASGGGAVGSTVTMQAPPFKGEGSLGALKRWVRDATAEFKRLNLAAAEQMRAMKANVDLQLGQLRTSATNRAVQIRAAMANQWVGARNDATTLFAGLRARVENALIGLRTSARTITEGTRSSVANAFVGMRNDAVQLSTSLKTGVVNQFSGMRARAGGAGEGETNALKASVRNAFSAMRDNAVAVAGSLRSGVVGQFVNLRLGVAAAMGGVRDVVASGIYAARDAANYAAGGFYYVGQNIAVGIRNGILSLAGMIASAAASIVNNAIAAANAAAKISSPSKRTEWTGRMISAGMALGIERGIGDVARAGSVLAGAAFGSASGSLTVGGGTPVAAVAGGRGGGTTLIVQGNTFTSNATDNEAVAKFFAREVVKEANVKGKPKGFR